MRQRGYALATSVWAEVRLGREKLPPDRPLTREIAAKTARDFVLVKLVSTTAGAEVSVDKVPRGKTSVERYLTKGRTYTVVFKTGGKECTRSFTPMADGDQCDGDV